MYNRLAFTKGEGKACWHCSCQLPDNQKDPETYLFCPGCKTLQPPREMDPFQRLHLEPKYALAPEEIEKSYFLWQSYLHPDRFISRKLEERKFAQHHSTLLNDAYNTLKDPLKRAVELLQLKGLEDPISKHKTKDQDILLEIMEWRQVLEKNASLEEAKGFLDKLQLEKDSIISALSTYFKEEELEVAAKEVRRLSFFLKVQSEARAKYFHLKSCI